MYEILRGCLLLYVAFFSWVFLGTKYKMHHYASIASISVGLLLVCAAPFLLAHKEVDKSKTTSFFGCLCIVLSQLFSATQSILEEKLLKGYHLDPFYVVGCEGVWGFAMMCFVLPCLGMVGACGPPYCSEFGYLENTRNAFS